MADEPLALTCRCCGYSQSFTDAEEAFQAGWDEPAHMPHWPVTCNLCPGAAAMGLLDHSVAHERWAQEGRPVEFSSEGLPKPSPEEMAAVEKLVEGFVRRKGAKEN